MKYQEVYAVAQERHIEVSDFTEAFEFRKDRPAPWLQKACFFVLRKLRAFHRLEEVSVSYRRIDADLFIVRLLKQQEHLARFFNLYSTTLLIGAEDYAKLMRELASNTQFSFNARYCYSDRPEIMGLKVHVIPWMRGCVVLPKGVKL